MHETYSAEYYNRNTSRLRMLKTGGYCSYEKLDNPKYWEKKIEKILEFQRGGKLLDIGCAYGYFLKHCPESFEKYGIDFSEHAIQKAKQSVPEAKLFNGCFLENNFKGKFDAITLFDSIEHLPELNKTLEKIDSMLEKNGNVFVYVPVNSRFQRILKKGGYSALYNDKTHKHIFSLKEWEKIFSEKFKVIECKPITHKDKFYKLTVYGWFVLKKQ